MGSRGVGRFSESDGGVPRATASRPASAAHGRLCLHRPRLRPDLLAGGADAGVDFLLFAARRPRLVRGWRWRPLPEAVARHVADARQPLLPSSSRSGCCPRHRVSVYLDANTLVLADLTPLIAEFLASGADIGLFRHQERSTPAEEFDFGRQVGKIPPSRRGEGPRAARAATARPGCPRTPPFTENAIIFRRHGSPALAAAMELWWAELENYIRRDQLSLPYVLFTLGARGQALGLELQIPQPLLHALPAPPGALERPQRVPEEQAGIRPAQHAL